MYTVYAFTLLIFFAAKNFQEDSGFGLRWNSNLRIQT